MNTYKFRTYFVLFVLFLSVFSCKKDDDEMIDKDKPTIDLSIENAFPKSCDTLYFGQTFTIKVLLSDNAELGSYNIDIHNNFDHHTHSTEFESCDENPVKTPVNPFVLIQDYDIPVSSKTYTVELPMTLPISNQTAPYDEGDYHFQITVIDKEGWSIMKGLNVKILQD